MVLIEDGTYLENVVVDHPLTLAVENITVWGISLTNGDDSGQVTGENTTLMDLNVAGCNGNGIALEGAVWTSILRVQVRGTAISFDVSLAWIEAQDASTGDIALFRYHDGAWVPLKTTYVKEENGEARYVAETPCFSYFAIAVVERAQGEGSPTSVEGVEEVPAGTPSPVIPIKPQSTPIGLFVPCLAVGLAILVQARRR